MFAKLEAEFNTIVNDVKTIPEKLEALVGLQSRAKELENLSAPLTAVIEDASKATAQKVEEILAMVGKL